MPDINYLKQLAELYQQDPEGVTKFLQYSAKRRAGAEDATSLAGAATGFEAFNAPGVERVSPPAPKPALSREMEPTQATAGIGTGFEAAGMSPTPEWAGGVGYQKTGRQLVAKAGEDIQIPAKTAIKAAPDPGIGQRLADAFAGPGTMIGALRGEQAQLGRPDIPGEQPIVNIENMLTNQEKVDHPILTGLDRFISGQSSPANVLTLGAIGAVGGAGEKFALQMGRGTAARAVLGPQLAGRLAESTIGRWTLGRLISLGFSAQMVNGLYESSKAFQQAYNNNDISGALTIAAEAVPQAVFAVMTGHEGILGKGMFTYPVYKDGLGKIVPDTITKKGLVERYNYTMAGANRIRAEAEERKANDPAKADELRRQAFKVEQQATMFMDAYKAIDLVKEAKANPSYPRTAAEQASTDPTKEALRGTGDSQEFHQLTPQGAQEVNTIAQNVAGQFDRIFSAGLGRHKTTAKILAGTNQNARVSQAKALNPMAWGGAEEMDAAKMDDFVKGLIEHPDNPAPGLSPSSGVPGETWNQFKQRTLDFVRKRMANLETNPQTKEALISSYNTIRLVYGHIAAGAKEDLSVDDAKVLKDHTEPGTMHRLYKDTDGTWKMDNYDPASKGPMEPGIYFLRHGSVALNKGATVEKAAAPPTEGSALAAQVQQLVAKAEDAIPPESPAAKKTLGAELEQHLKEAGISPEGVAKVKAATAKGAEEAAPTGWTANLETNSLSHASGDAFVEPTETGFRARVRRPTGKIESLPSAKYKGADPKDAYGFTTKGAAQRAAERYMAVRAERTPAKPSLAEAIAKEVKPAEVPPKPPTPADTGDIDTVKLQTFRMMSDENLQRVIANGEKAKTSPRNEQTQHQINNAEAAKRVVAERAQQATDAPKQIEAAKQVREQAQTLPPAQKAQVEHQADKLEAAATGAVPKVVTEGLAALRAKGKGVPERKGKVITVPEVKSAPKPSEYPGLSLKEATRLEELEKIGASRPRTEQERNELGRLEAKLAANQIINKAASETEKSKATQKVKSPNWNWDVVENVYKHRGGYAKTEYAQSTKSVRATIEIPGQEPKLLESLGQTGGSHNDPFGWEDHATAQKAAEKYLKSLMPKQPKPTGSKLSQALKEAAAQPVAVGGSGESAASQEAINRLAAEKNAGVTRLRINTKTGQEIPLVGVDAVDAKANKHEVIVMRDIQGNESVLDRHASVVKYVPKAQRVAEYKAKTEASKEAVKIAKPATDNNSTVLATLEGKIKAAKEAKESAQKQNVHPSLVAGFDRRIETLTKELEERQFMQANPNARAPLTPTAAPEGKHVWEMSRKEFLTAPRTDEFVAELRGLPKLPKSAEEQAADKKLEDATAAVEAAKLGSYAYGEGKQYASGLSKAKQKIIKAYNDAMSGMLEVSRKERESRQTQLWRMAVDRAKTEGKPIPEEVLKEHQAKPTLATEIKKAAEPVVAKAEVAKKEATIQQETKDIAPIPSDRTVEAHLSEDATGGKTIGKVTAKDGRQYNLRIEPNEEGEYWAVLRNEGGKKEFRPIKQLDPKGSMEDTIDELRTALQGKKEQFSADIPLEIQPPTQDHSAPPNDPTQPDKPGPDEGGTVLGMGFNPIQGAQVVGSLAQQALASAKQSIAAGIKKAALVQGSNFFDAVDAVRAATTIDKKLDALQRAHQSVELFVREMWKKLPPEMQQEDFYHAREAGTMTPEQTALWNQYLRPIEEATAKLGLRLAKKNLPWDNQFYVHREVKGEHGLLDRMAEAHLQSRMADMWQQYVNDPNKDIRVRNFAKGLAQAIDEADAQAGRGGKTNVLKTTASPLKGRDFYAIEDANGKRSLINITSVRTHKGAILRYVYEIDSQGKFTRLGRIKSRTQFFGKDFADENGNVLGKIVNARTTEIEANTGLEYYHNLPASVLSAFTEVTRAAGALKFMEELITDPASGKYFHNLSGAGKVPVGWKTARMPQLNGYAVEPHMAAALDRYYDEMWTKGANAGLLSKMNGFLRTSIFFNPFIHVPNISIHWLVNRGATAWMPNFVDAGKVLLGGGTAGDAGRALFKDYTDMVKAGYKAWEVVGNPFTKGIGDPNKMANLMAEAAPMMSWNLQGESFYDMVARELGAQVSKTNFAREMLGRGAIVPEAMKALVKGWYNISARITWKVNDLAVLQSVFEEQGRGMSLKKAIEETRKHIPDYTIPTHVLGTQLAGQLMRNGNWTMFGAYHYGALKSYGEMAKSIMAKTPDPGERAAALDKLAMLVITNMVVYPIADKIGRYITGTLGDVYDKATTAVANGSLAPLSQIAIKQDPDWHLAIRRAGAATFPHNIVRLSRGEITPQQFLEAMVTPAILIKSGLSLWQDYDSFFRRPVYGPHDDARKVFANVLHYAVGQVAPVGVSQRFTREELTGGKFAKQLFGIGYPKNPVEKFAADTAIARMAQQPEEAETETMSRTRRTLAEELRAGRYGKFYAAQSKLSPIDVENIVARATMSKLQYTMRNFGLEDLVKAYDFANQKQWAYIPGIESRETSPKQQRDEIKQLILKKMDTARKSKRPPSRELMMRAMQIVGGF